MAGTQFDEFKHRRDNGGRFAEKGPSPEAGDVDLHASDADRSKVADMLAGRGWDADRFHVEPDGGVTVVHNTYSPIAAGRVTSSGALSLVRDTDGTWAVESSRTEYEHDYYMGMRAVDGDRERIVSGLGRDEAVTAFADAVDAANSESELDDRGPVYDVAAGEPGPVQYHDPWATS